MALEDVVAKLAPVTLEELDERSALRRRIDTKYVVPAEPLSGLVERLADAYDVLEIDGQRGFSYESVYFDTPDLRCFRDHVDGRRPRFKARTRLYRETDACFFEVKIRVADEMVKRQCPYGKGMHGALDEPARRFLDETLRDLAAGPAPADLAPTLSTRYDRTTLGAREGGERATIDVAVELRSMDGRAVSLREGYTLVETKSEETGGRVDALLREAGYEPQAMSKYRLGVGLLLAEDPDSARVQPLRNCFA